MSPGKRTPFTVIVAASLLPTVACDRPQPVARPIAISPKPTPTQDTELNNPAQRLARAAEVRDYLENRSIAAWVVATDRKLTITYKNAHADYLLGTFQTFCRQRRADGIDALIKAGFEEIEIRANDSFGKTQSRIFPISDCKNLNLET